jgi:hypothetical protein
MSNLVSIPSSAPIIGRSPGLYIVDRDPYEYDIGGYDPGDWWLNSDSFALFYLGSLAGTPTSRGSLAHWIEVSSGASGDVVSLTAGDGTVVLPTAGTITLINGANINTTGSNAPGTVTINLNKSILLPATTGPTVGVIAFGTDLSSDRILHNYSPGGSGNGNIFLGWESGNFSNTGIGSNTGLGALTLNSLTTGSSNLAAGVNTLSFLEGGDFNTSLGTGSLSLLVGGNYNISIGNLSGVGYRTNESSNILINNRGIALENNTIRIGTQGSGGGQQNVAYMAGITGTTTSTVSDNKLVNVGTDGQLGETKLISLDSSVDISSSVVGGLNTINLMVNATGPGGELTPTNFGTNFSQPFLYYLPSTINPMPQAVTAATTTLGSNLILVALYDYTPVGAINPGSGLGVTSPGFTYTAVATGLYKFEAMIVGTQPGGGGNQGPVFSFITAGTVRYGNGLTFIPYANLNTGTSTWYVFPTISLTIGDVVSISYNWIQPGTTGTALIGGTPPVINQLYSISFISGYRIA